jgi:hypothetical protein
VRKLAIAMAYEMKAIHKRLDKLEVRCGLGPETEEHRQWRDRFQRAMQRLAADRVSRGLPPEPPDPYPGVDRRGMTVSQLLRLRYTHKQPQEMPKTSPDS